MGSSSGTRPGGLLGSLSASPVMVTVGVACFMGMKFLSKRGTQYTKRLPKSFKAAVTDWETVALGGAHNSSAEASLEFAQFSAGPWNRTTLRFRKITRTWKKRRALIETHGSRLAVLPLFLSEDECDHLIRLGSDPAATLDPYPTDPETGFELPTGANVDDTNSGTSGDGASGDGASGVPSGPRYMRNRTRHGGYGADEVGLKSATFAAADCNMAFASSALLPCAN